MGVASLAYSHTHLTVVSCYVYIYFLELETRCIETSAATGENVGRFTADKVGVGGKKIGITREKIGLLGGK